MMFPYFSISYHQAYKMSVCSNHLINKGFADIKLVGCFASYARRNSPGNNYSLENVGMGLSHWQVGKLFF